VEFVVFYDFPVVLTALKFAFNGHWTVFGGGHGEEGVRDVDVDDARQAAAARLRLPFGEIPYNNETEFATDGCSLQVS
jgi:hypothetical protein